MSILQEAIAERVAWEAQAQKARRISEGVHQLESDTIDLLLRATEAVERRASELDKR